MRVRYHTILGSNRSAFLVRLLGLWALGVGTAAWAQSGEHAGVAPAEQATFAFARLHRPAPQAIAAHFDRIKQSATDFVVADEATLFSRSDSSGAMAVLKRGEYVHRVRESGPWSIVRTLDRRVGFMASSALSNVWILVSKSKQRVFVMREETIVKAFDADMSVVPEGDKERRGSAEHPDQRRTPEGLFYISRRNPHSQFHLALVISYPSPGHAERGLRRGLISREQYAEIVKASMVVKSPPMNTRLGGLIEFHGSGVAGKANWTDGCIALSNGDMEELWDLVEVGTPVLIEP